MDDLTKYQITLDLWALEDYIQILELELPQIIENERKRIWKNVIREDEQQTHYAEIAEQQLETGLTTRFVSGAALIAIWALYESIVKRTAKKLQESKNLELQLREIKGSFPLAARKYFAEVLKFELHLDETDWNNLTMIYGLRNALAHANGQMADVNDNDRRRIEQWLANLEGVKIIDDFLIVDIHLVKWAFDFIKGLIEDLDKRISASQNS